MDNPILVAGLRDLISLPVNRDQRKIDGKSWQGPVGSTDLHS